MKDDRHCLPKSVVRWMQILPKPWHTAANWSSELATQWLWASLKDGHPLTEARQLQAPSQLLSLSSF